MRHRGYTLVEVLVVVGVIAAIVAILFPVFATVRENGRMAKCISNLHQWGTAIQMYRDDWGGIDPEPGRKINSKYELGLPPVPQFFVFLADYKLDHPGVRYCPSAREYHPGQKAPYQTLFEAETEDNPATLAAFEQRGGEMPMMACWQHNAEPLHEKNPTWAVLRVLILRFNQRVETVKLGSQPGSSFTW